MGISMCTLENHSFGGTYSRSRVHLGVTFRNPKKRFNRFNASHEVFQSFYNKQEQNKQVEEVCSVSGLCEVFKTCF